MADIQLAQLTSRRPSRHSLNLKRLSLDDTKIGVVVFSVQRGDHVLGHGNIAFIDHGAYMRSKSVLEWISVPLSLSLGSSDQ
jgi:hypothetical protein